MFCLAMTRQGGRIVGPEGAIMRATIALLAGTKFVNSMKTLVVMHEHVLSGGVDIKASFYQRRKVTSGKDAGVYAERGFV
jgi:hypothetical protein